jgi:hypothetical protein
MMFMPILLDHHVRPLELAAEIERIKAPKKENEPKGIEKFLQAPAKGVESCQPTIETTLPPENS